MTTYKVQFDGDGNMVDPEAPSVQTKEDYEANPITGGAQIGTMKLQGEETVQRIQVGSDLALAEKDIALDDFAGAFAEELNLIDAQLTAGQVPPPAKFREMIQRLADLQIRHVQLGGDENDETLVWMRQQVNFLSDRADAKRR